jgi:NAD(P)H-hydrate epimerase
VQTAVPEAMVNTDPHDSMFTEFPDLAPFSAIGIGPGLNTKHNSKKALFQLLNQAQVPFVIDADALNILAENPEWLEKLPEGSILTPHPGEFIRLVGQTENTYQRMQKQIEFSKKYRCVTLVKGAYTSISTPEGKVYFNSTGNPGMATAGSGDVLTGIILGLLAQEMSAEEAAMLGVYVHGLAGDLAIQQQSQMALVAGDIINNLGKAFFKLEN